MRTNRSDVPNPTSRTGWQAKRGNRPERSVAARPGSRRRSPLRNSKNHARDRGKALIIRFSASNMPYRIVVSANTGLVARRTTISFDAPAVSLRYSAKMPDGRPRPGKALKISDRAAIGIPTAARLAALTQGNQESATNRWPEWTDPLDFQEVPTEEAVARINAAGYFVLTCNGDIYKTDPNGGIALQRPGGFNNVFACRYARETMENWFQPAWLGTIRQPVVNTIKLAIGQTTTVVRQNRTICGNAGVLSRNMATGRLSAITSFM